MPPPLPRAKESEEEMTFKPRPWTPSEIKDDHRPAKGMWCPGDYLCTCLHCGAYFAGDKRSNCCADCAYKTPEVKEP
jgi:hypothetical protein